MLETHNISTWKDLSRILAVPCWQQPLLVLTDRELEARLEKDDSKKGNDKYKGDVGFTNEAEKHLFSRLKKQAFCGV